AQIHHHLLHSPSYHASYLHRAHGRTDREALRRCDPHRFQSRHQQRQQWPDLCALRGERRRT
ncbi:hypothetical protein C8F04DRAFT_1395652, partial [Mycena alexandri]